MKTILYPNSFEHWRTTARQLLADGIAPEAVFWSPSDEGSLFDAEFIASPSTPLPQGAKVPKGFVDLARTVAYHRSDTQWALLYTLLWRIINGERHLLGLGTDPLVHRLRAMAKAIGRDNHKMHAFVRFRKVGDCEQSGREQFVAWFEPDHRIVRLTAGFFQRRFTGMDWSILTPDECVHWDGKKLQFTAGVDRSEAPSEDALDELWRGYYRSIFNPARLKVKAMQAEMPKKYWKNLPEAELIEELIAESASRTQTMLTAPASPEKPAPKNRYLARLQKMDEDDGLG